MLTTFKAKGLVPDDHPLGARRARPQRHAGRVSWLMNESDLLLVFGASFSNHTGIAPYKPIVQVDVDPDALGRFHPVTVPVLGDVGVTARAARRARSPAAPCRRVDQRADVAARLGDLARREGAPRRRRPRPRRRRRPRCSTR